MASPITGVSIIYSTVCSGADQRKHQSSTVLVFAHTKGQQRGKCFHLMTSSWGKGTIPWWRHQMETFSALLALCAGKSPVPVNSTHKGQWRGALMFSLICVWINVWVNTLEDGDLRRHLDHYDVSVMLYIQIAPAMGCSLVLQNVC